ncbi:tripartite tricarboxylate transporter substrate binding protein [endosymbiont of Ridgeia piscesae]|jgi:tripartite-type tricarboxylate transporter receptor subunit TctC|uniref:Tripartite-type tricarboxylate transporter, receptor component TctC n=1 Tax=endosymbiont of Ridgeia piscesae TaxID=54398 RepID=A0A0T5Z046_9GAMM|nr:tripartite tricarboxylate transporter substrate binding protein [endosymbiont of Ridgeia piscesae]KRT56143.1 Tripartite-type tricarboxylate transporter, receptor component TctC [endosymbiont of Ridgeia piscesae]KRT58825.1 Tripartite-type tricarboxylate transporter, receptor component TctC [endosymbiont of Ridgeia piscesae]
MKITSYRLAGLLCFCLMLADEVFATDYPQRAITLIVPYSPGGASDLAARTLAVSARHYVEQPITVINRSGGGGLSGANAVHNSPADGYTLLLARIGSNLILPTLHPNPPYQWDSFQFIGLLERNPLVYVVRADSPIDSLDTLLASIKQRRQPLSYATAGVYSLLNISVQMLLQTAKIPLEKTVMLPYRGGGGAMNALLGSQVELLGINLSTVIEQIRAGQLHALAVTTPQRINALPETPTVREAGFPELENLTGWSGLWAPKPLPQVVSDYWHAVLQRLAKDPEWQTLTRQRGSIPDIRTPQQTHAFVAAQYRQLQQLSKGGKGL